MEIEYLGLLKISSFKLSVIDLYEEAASFVCWWSYYMDEIESGMNAQSVVNNLRYNLTWFAWYDGDGVRWWSQPGVTTWNELSQFTYARTILMESLLYAQNRVIICLYKALVSLCIFIWVSGFVSHFEMWVSFTSSREICRIRISLLWYYFIFLSFRVLLILGLEDLAFNIFNSLKGVKSISIRYIV